MGHDCSADWLWWNLALYLKAVPSTFVEGFCRHPLVKKITFNFVLTKGKTYAIIISRGEDNDWKEPPQGRIEREAFEGGHVHWMPPAPWDSQDCVQTQTANYKSRKERAVNGSYGFLNLRSCDFHPVHRKLILDKSLQKWYNKDTERGNAYELVWWDDGQNVLTFSKSILVDTTKWGYNKI